MHLFSWDELRALLERHDCDVVAASAANFLSIGNDEICERWLARRRRCGNGSCDGRSPAARSPGAIDAGTHIIAVDPGALTARHPCLTADFTPLREERLASAIGPNGAPSAGDPGPGARVERGEDLASTTAVHLGGDPAGSSASVDPGDERRGPEGGGLGEDGGGSGEAAAARWEERTSRAQASTSRASGRRTRHSPRRASPRSGDQKLWLALDDTNQLLYLKLYTLRAIGNNIDVWVASDTDDTSTATDFPDGDCRNGPRTQLTDAQASYLLAEFDANIFPKESSTFSVAPERDGALRLSDLLDESLAELVNPNGPATGRSSSWTTCGTRASTTSTLRTGSSYIAGFFSDQLNEALDRNIMTIDAFDWLHRTGASPPDEPVPGNFCTSAPARPFLYEGVFAHEYQHLLESYEDPARPSG